MAGGYAVLLPAILLLGLGFYIAVAGIQSRGLYVGFGWMDGWMDGYACMRG
jgi:hypothetical protein